MYMHGSNFELFLIKGKTFEKNVRNKLKFILHSLIGIWHGLVFRFAIKEHLSKALFSWLLWKQVSVIVKDWLILKQKLFKSCLNSTDIKAETVGNPTLLEQLEQ